MATSIKLKWMPSKISGKEGVICLQLIHNRKIKLQRTRFRLFPVEWDSHKENVVFGNSELERQGHLESVKIGLEAELKRLEESIRLLEHKGEYTVEELVEIFVSNSFSGYFFRFAEYIVKNLKENNRLKTASIFVTAKSSFERFREGRDVLLEKMDNALMLEYESWLKHSGVMKNTISCYMRTLRSIYNQAIKRGLGIQKNPFTNIFTRNDKTIKRAVDENTIIQIRNLDLASHKELALARDLFMFSFYLRGISFVDMANLRTVDLKNGYIIYTRSKTKQVLSVKMEVCMQEIISRYERETLPDYLLPIYTLQNQDSSSQLRNHNNRLKRISEMLGLEKSLSSYVSRHSWATIALRKGISIEVISEGMGHENESTTRIYLASLGQSAVDTANAEIIKL